jgi:hypothetical protein
VIALSYGNPYVLAKIASVPAYLLGYGERGWYGNQLVYAESFIRVLQGALVPGGSWPIK